MRKKKFSKKWHHICTAVVQNLTSDCSFIKTPCSICMFPFSRFQHLHLLGNDCELCACVSVVCTMYINFEWCMLMPSELQFHFTLLYFSHQSTIITLCRYDCDCNCSCSSSCCTHFIFIIDFSINVLNAKVWRTKKKNWLKHQAIHIHAQVVSLKSLYISISLFVFVASLKKHFAVHKCWVAFLFHPVHFIASV